MSEKEKPTDPIERAKRGLLPDPIERYLALRKRGLLPEPDRWPHDEDKP